VAGFAIGREVALEGTDLRPQDEGRIIKHRADRGVDLGTDPSILGLQIDKGDLLR
jgi:hypothetical protein